VYRLAESNFFNKNLSVDERDLYDRQFRLDGWDQNILKKSRVLIVGVGGLGCEIAKNLAMVGVGYLDLVDMDVIEHSNLNRQILFSDAKMGESKAKAAARKLKEINPFITVVGHHVSLERLNPKYYAEADLVIGGLDSMNARYNLNAHCIRFKKPLIDGGVAGYHGHIYTIFPYDNACFECYPVSAAESDEMAACTVVGIPRKRVHCVYKGNMAFKEQFKDDPNPKNIEHIRFIMKTANELVTKHNFLPVYTEAEVVKILDRHEPGVITINSIVSAIQSQEAVKILNYLKGNHSLGEPLKEYLILNAMTMKLYYLEKKRNAECIQCGYNVKRVIIKINEKSKCQSIMDSLLKMGLELDPELEPILTTMDFNSIRLIDFDTTPADNGIRNLELITAAGFKGGQVFITLEIAPNQ
jgi:molybdopterin/thiamine biosynthesis adenylyltransferase